MRNERLKDYQVDGKINMDQIIDDFYGYVSILVKNSVTTNLTDEDLEEIISDVFVAIWRNQEQLSETTLLKPYLVGIAKNKIKNKYRKSELSFSLSDYEEKLSDPASLEREVQENEQNSIIQKGLEALKTEEYTIFILFYYEAKKIKEIADTLHLSEGKVKVILHRVRKSLKRNLEDGGYGYGK